MPLRERRQVARRRTGEAVDRLVDVTDDTDVRAIIEPQLEESLLKRAGVLILVDREPALPPPDRVGGLVVVLEELYGLDEQVIEVDPARARLRSLVALERPDEQVERDRWLATRRQPTDLRLVPARRDPARLRPLDLVGEILRRGEPIVPGQLSG